MTRKHLGRSEEANKHIRSADGKDDPAVLKELADAQGKLAKIIASQVKAGEKDPK